METGTNGKRTIQPKIPENSGGKSNGTDIPGTKFWYTLQSHPLFGKLENAVQLFTGYFWKFNLNFFSCVECALRIRKAFSPIIYSVSWLFSFLIVTKTVNMETLDYLYIC